MGLSDDNGIEAQLWNGSRQSTTQLLTSISTLAQGGKRMNRKEIIFFDELGFGWIVDKDVIKKQINNFIINIIINIEENSI